MKRLLIAQAIAAALCLSSVAQAKLPPPSDEAKAKAAEAAAKSAHQAKVAAYEVCKVQDQIAAQYLRGQKNSANAASAPVAAPPATPPCVEPGAFAYQAKDRPIEEAGAHSPAATTGLPPSTTTPHGEMAPAK